MTLIRRGSPFAAVLLLLAAAPRAHALIPGGGPPGKVDCYAEWLVNLDSFSPSGNTVNCADGDPDCDGDGTPNGACTFNVGVCINQTNLAPKCTPHDVTSLSFTKKAASFGLKAPPLGSAAVCGDTVPVQVPLIRITKGKNKGKFKASKPITLGMTAKSSAKPSTDRDKLKLRCLPSKIVKPCAANPAGPTEPNELRFRVAAAGTDLDNGWRGASHNFPTPEGTTFQLCLQNCNSTTNPKCDTVATTGPDTFNGKFFGAPLPLVTAGVPVCVLNNFAATTFTGGTANLQTGEVNGPIKLNSAVFLTSVEQVCPSCEGAKCDSGPAQGQACSIDGTVTVTDPSAPRKTYHLSKDCPPPQDNPAGPPLHINLPLTTGTSTLAPLPGGNAQVPCVQQAGEPSGITPKADLCGGGVCNAKCAGNACANPSGVDFATGATVCVDAKGGISQFCCSNAPSLPCFPTGPGSAGQIARTGKPTVPTPPWPDPTYPKQTTCRPGACTVQVATFCEAATGGSSVDGLTGLPGPGALILPVSTLWLKPATP